MIDLKIRCFRDGAVMPTQGSDFASGFDLYAWIRHEVQGESLTAIAVPPNSMVPIKTGLNIRIPAGVDVQIRPRSGLAYNHQVTIQNAPGTIDGDFDGDFDKFEVIVMLRNEGSKPFVVNHGDRIAQMVVHRLPSVRLIQDFGDNLNRNVSNRTGGLGSTGT